MVYVKEFCLKVIENNWDVNNRKIAKDPSQWLKFRAFHQPLNWEVTQPKKEILRSGCIIDWDLWTHREAVYLRVTRNQWLNGSIGIMSVLL